MDTNTTNEFNGMMEQTKDFLWSQAMGMTRRSEDAEDLLQETILKAFKAWESFEPGTNFKAWAGKIMLNTHINNVNRKREMSSCDFSSGECERMLHMADDSTRVTYGDNPEKIFFNKHIDGKLVQALYELPDSFRVPFTLFHFEGFQYEDISKMLNLPIGTVKSRIFRARKALKDTAELRKLAG